MKRNIKRDWGIFFVLMCVALLSSACGAKEPPKDEPADYSGRYTDKQDTAEVYSELELSRNEDGTYAVALSMYRLVSMVGTADEVGDGKLHFDSYVPDIHVAGDIVISGGTAELTITESDTDLLEPGAVYRFPDGE